MCVCVYVCVCICMICVCAYIYIHVYIYICMCKYVSMWIMRMYQQNLFLKVYHYIYLLINYNSFALFSN